MEAVVQRRKLVYLEIACSDACAVLIAQKTEHRSLMQTVANFAQTRPNRVRAVKSGNWGIQAPKENYVG